MLRLILRISVFALLAPSLLAGQSGKASSTSAANFIGEWKVGLGIAGESFTITLEKGGKATKSHGSPDGTWTVYGNEAQITWNDGWHDVLGGPAIIGKRSPTRPGSRSPTSLTTLLERHEPNRCEAQVHALAHSGTAAQVYGLALRHFSSKRCTSDCPMRTRGWAGLVLSSSF